MSSLAFRQQALQADRRRNARFTTEIPVTLQTVLGNRQGRISNISDRGAMIEVSSPPPENIAACLILGEEELFCTVVWSNEDACGVEFDRAIGDAKLAEIAGEELEQQRERGPVANVGNIQPGRKRGRLVAGG
ncbi:MAG: PilZ domain-containing protein [Erythrobacter sp.]|uniref:PilZ domain-containing protein n=1 Tax=Erythrobacter sp. TaxID=1042 RepID=UPI003C75BE0A